MCTTPNEYLFTFEFCTGNSEYYFSKVIVASNDLEACNSFLEVIGATKAVETVEDFLDIDSFEDENYNIFKSMNFKRI